MLLFQRWHVVSNLGCHHSAQEEPAQQRGGIEEGHYSIITAGVVQQS